LAPKGHIGFQTSQPITVTKGGAVGKNRSSGERKEKSLPKTSEKKGGPPDVINSQKGHAAVANKVRTRIDPAPGNRRGGRKWRY